jgi:hypothetical protein
MSMTACTVLTAVEVGAEVGAGDDAVGVGVGDVEVVAVATVGDSMVNCDASGKVTLTPA